MIQKFLTLVLISVFISAVAQKTIVIPKHLQNSMDSIKKQNLSQSLETFFSEMKVGRIDEDLLTAKRADLTKRRLQELVNYESKKDSLAQKIEDKQLINIYPISDNEYFISISYTYHNRDSNPILFYIINLIATSEKGKFTFSVPIDYITRYWKTKIVGNITYHFRNEINIEKAKVFDIKNIAIAKRQGLNPDKLDFYMTENFQEILQLTGFGYSIYSNGKYKDGFGVESNTVFAISNNEDFSHDMVHYYSGKINKRENRNWISEEGIAYAWGNAYYADENGEMITLKRLKTQLKNYLTKNPHKNLYELFINDEKIFSKVTPEISVRSTISGIIAEQVDREKGRIGIEKLINSGNQDQMKNYLNAVEELIGITKDNFNLKVGKLINIRIEK